MRNYYTMLYYTAFICLSSLWGQVALHANANATRLEANNLHCIDELLSNFLRHYKANEILFVWDLNYTHKQHKLAQTNLRRDYQTNFSFRGR